MRDRQKQALAQLLADRPPAHPKGTSTRRHMRLMGCSKATASRDLISLVKLGALERLLIPGKVTIHSA